MTALDFAGRIRNVRKTPSGEYTGHCPAHEDQRSSLSWRDGTKGLVVHCHAGCTLKEIADRLNMALSEFFTDSAQTRIRPQSGPPSGSTIVCTYQYCDEKGELLYETVRFEPKHFMPRRPSAGGWIWGLAAVRRVLYRLPHLSEASKIFLVEGEKDADALWDQGLPATTTQGGANSWKKDYVEQFLALAPEEIIILPDNDKSGRDYASTAALDLREAGLRVRVVQLPELPDKGDVSDYFASGKSVEDLEEEVRPRIQVIRSMNELLKSTPKEPIWLVENILRETTNGWIGAQPKVGKSYLALDFLISCVLGEPWLGHFKVARPMTVVLLEEEDDTWRVYSRLMRLLQGRGIDSLPDTFYYEIRSGIRLDRPDTLEPLLNDLEIVRPDLVVWDVFRNLHSLDERKPEQMMPMLAYLDQLRDRYHLANLMTHHHRKGSNTGPDQSSQGGEKLRGPSEFWGWAENSLYLDQGSKRGHVIIQVESKDSDAPERFKAHLEDTSPDSRRWVYDGVIEAKLDRGAETRKKILSNLPADGSGQPVEWIAAAMKMDVRSIRRHLAALENDGAVEGIAVPGGRGKKLWILVKETQIEGPDL